MNVLGTNLSSACFTRLARHSAKRSRLSLVSITNDGSASGDAASRFDGPACGDAASRFDFDGPASSASASRFDFDGTAGGDAERACGDAERDFDGSAGGDAERDFGDAERDFGDAERDFDDGLRLRRPLLDDMAGCSVAGGGDFSGWGGTFKRMILKVRSDMAYLSSL